MELDWFSFGSEIAGAIVGGVIAGYFSLAATKRSFINQRAHAEENESILTKGLLQSIHDEIETVFERYQETMGSKVESMNEDDALVFYYPLVSDFFSVYNGNTFLIGRITDNDLRKQIIKTYTLAKDMIDSFRLNNDLVHKYELSCKIFDESKQEVHRLQAIAHYQSLVSYAKSIRQGHGSLKSEIYALLRNLRKHGVLSENSN